jgi:hypothetical protein
MILLHVKNPFKALERYFEGQIHNILQQVPPDLLLDGSASTIARDRWWIN